MVNPQVLYGLQLCIKLDWNSKDNINVPPPLITTPITTCQRTTVTNAPRPKWTQQRTNNSHDNECEEKNEWCMKKEKKEEEVSRDNFGKIVGCTRKMLGVGRKSP